MGPVTGGMDLNGGKASGNGTSHGGKRAGSGRKSTAFNVISRVGQACEEMLRQKYVALNAEKKRELLEERSNIAVFHEYIQGIPIAERTAFLASDDYANHSKSMDEELTQLGQPNNELGKRSRILTIPTRRLYGYNARIYEDVALKFGLSPVQVKNYWQKYRKFIRDSSS